MGRRILIVCALCMASSLATAQNEFRGAWIATVHNLDWPSRPGLSSNAQKAELTRQLEFAKALGLNAIIFQVRPSCDAFYKSSLEPWSPFLTGKMAGDPGYDPLEFAIREARRLGLQLHAWFNPYRALATTRFAPSSNHISRRHPDWVRRHGTQLWLDPGLPEVLEHTTRVILDVVSRYEIDGVHMDDYFYPYPTRGTVQFDDAVTYARYRDSGGRLPKSDWRRANVNRLVSTLHARIKAVKPHVMFGVSPFGIWRPGVPPTIEAQLNAYEQLAADSRTWLQNGWVDYLAPQLYWSIEPPKQSFATLLDWWRNQSVRGIPIWPGIAVDRVGEGRPSSEIARQITLTRKDTDRPGHILWSLKDVRSNRDRVADLLRKEVYRTR